MPAADFWVCFLFVSVFFTLLSADFSLCFIFGSAGFVLLSAFFAFFSAAFSLRFLFASAFFCFSSAAFSSFRLYGDDVIILACATSHLDWSTRTRLGITIRLLSGVAELARESATTESTSAATLTEVQDHDLETSAWVTSDLLRLSSESDCSAVSTTDSHTDFSVHWLSWTHQTLMVCWVTVNVRDVNKDLRAKDQGWAGDWLIVVPLMTDPRMLLASLKDDNTLRTVDACCACDSQQLGGHHGEPWWDLLLVGNQSQHLNSVELHCPVLPPWSICPLCCLLCRWLWPERQLDRQFRRRLQSRPKGQQY